MCGAVLHVCWYWANFGYQSQIIIVFNLLVELIILSTCTLQTYCDDIFGLSSTVTTFAVSAIVSHSHKLDMVHIQNATLAGGVAVGAVCNLLIGPHGALLIGVISGIISVLGYRYLTVSFMS